MKIGKFYELTNRIFRRRKNEVSFPCVVIAWATSGKSILTSEKIVCEVAHYLSSHTKFQDIEFTLIPYGKALSEQNIEHHLLNKSHRTHTFKVRWPRNMCFHGGTLVIIFLLDCWWSITVKVLLLRRSYIYIWKKNGRASCGTKIWIRYFFCAYFAPNFVFRVQYSAFWFYFFTEDSGFISCCRREVQVEFLLSVVLSKHCSSALSTTPNPVSHLFL